MANGDSKAVFFLRHHNDLDHITPVIYKWLTTTGCPADIFITTEARYLDDFRVRFLQILPNQRVFALENVIGDQCDMARVMAEPAFAEALVDGVFQGFSGGVIAFDWTMSEFVRNVMTAGRRRGIPTVALPHGDAPHINSMLHTEHLDYSALENYRPHADFDYVVTPNSLCARRYTRFMPEARVPVLGSPRYCDEWLAIMSAAIPPYNWEGSRAGLKILFLLRDYNYPVFWEEAARTNRLVLQFPDAFLVVKHHTRSATVQQLMRDHPDLEIRDHPRFRMVYDEAHTASLIAWADVVLDIGTSAAFEAVKRGKPVLSLEYLHAGRTTVAHHIRACDIQYRDQLYDWMVRFQTDRNAAFYDEDERKQFVSRMLEFPDGKVLERYVGFLKKCAGVTAEIADFNAALVGLTVGAE
jgi:hypothetical protein